MQITAGRYWGKLFYPFNFSLSWILLWALVFLMSGCATTNSINTAPLNIPLLEKWSGDYPVPELGRLPEGQQNAGTGYIGDPETFIPVWRAFMPQEILPVVDFSKNIVVFTRNTEFYNQTFILKVALHDGTVEIITMKTLSAMPIKERVAMAMAVIPRDGIMAIQANTEKIQVMPHQ